jgi:diguanylate cyclase (GGDEF)-like protein
MADLEQLSIFRQPSVLVILDLDGFKAYNDSFGHPAGDALLVRLASRLATVDQQATAYRLGGDEFCVVWAADAQSCARLEAAAAAAMGEHGDGFSISASYGSVSMPAQAATVEAALRVADHRMYARKHGSRSSPRTQTRDVLIRALAERHPELGAHVDAVTVLAGDVARRLRLPEDEVEQVRHAAELHDIGKVAIPDALISKPGPLDQQEWDFMRQHTLIGERILRAAPALRKVAALVRSTHERVDGHGYPDGLAGEQIPIGSRIIAVCDAYDAMTSDRPYRLAQDSESALAELNRCAGKQFDPAVVAAFTEALGDPRPREPGPAFAHDGVV